MREVCRALFHRFDWPKWTTGAPQELLALLPPAQEHILAQENGTAALSGRRAGALPRLRACRAPQGGAGHPGRPRLFQAVRAQLMKQAPGEARSEEELVLTTNASAFSTALIRWYLWRREASGWPFVSDGTPPGITPPPTA